MWQVQSRSAGYLGSVLLKRVFVKPWDRLMMRYLGHSQQAQQRENP